jgi:predicted heme/steroid binding protein
LDPLKLQSELRQRNPKIINDLNLFSAKELPLITKSQLALRNGQDKPEVWVALNNLVYDVTASRLWLKGKHYEHWAGQDLSDELRDAPHTEKVFDKFKVIGRLKN